MTLMNNEAAAHTPPTNLSEYNRRFALNQEITGFGITGVEQHTPCPFCAAKDFLVHKILDTETAFAKGAQCRECGRSAKAIFKHERGGTQFEIVQTGGPDQPAWLEPQMRRVSFDIGEEPEIDYVSEHNRKAIDEGGIPDPNDR